MMKQLGLNTEDLDINGLVKQMQWLQTSGGVRFGTIPAAQNPDTAWRTTTTAARHLVSKLDPDPSFSPGEKLAVIDAERLAQSWLDPVTRFISSGTPPVTLCHEDWIESTSIGWRRLVEPIIDELADALQCGTTTLEDPQFADLSSILAPMVWTSVSLIYRNQLGRMLASVAGSTLTDSKVGTPLTQGSTVAMLPVSIAEFIRDPDLPDDDVMLYLLLREASKQRLFHGVEWPSPQPDALLVHYAREIRIDFEALSSQLDIDDEEVSLKDIVAAGEKVCGSFFRSANTGLQLEILDRLEVLLTLIEGWVNYTTDRAVSNWMTNSAQFNEMVRRRHASAGPTHEVFQDLLGLELHPHLVRDAENPWAVMGHCHGTTECDGIRQRPDMLPIVRHLEDPLSYVHPTRRGDDDGDSGTELHEPLGK